MASGTVTSSVPPESRRAKQERELIEYERYIDLELNKTARQVQGMDIMVGLMCWLAGTLAYLSVAAVADHWLISGGLGTAGRWLALVGLLAGSGWFLAKRVLPALLRRINPVYSAHTIERGRPQLKNSLVNFLLLRNEPRELPELVRDALQAQAANGLAAAPVEQSIDRSPLVRFSLVLLGAVLVSALYIMFSPKDPLRSAARVILPWASIDRPTRFKIQEIQAEIVETGRKFTGGPAEVFYGQRVKITATVTNRGRVAAEPVVLRFTTADGAAEDQALTLEARERNADITLPAGTLAAAVGGGLQQSLDYTLTAGDAVAGPFHINVLAAPSIEIESLEYDYPDYTKLPNRIVAGPGDVNGLEGARVIVRARANQEIAQAWLDLDCDNRRDATMQSKGQEASVNFQLALKEDSRTSVNASYWLRFKNTDGFENSQPIRYRVDVTPDLAPEIAWESPREIDEPRELPIDEALELMFAGRDRDFELAAVTLRSEVETEVAAEKRPWEKSLLSAPTGEKWQSKSVAFVPAEHGYRAGETVTLWAVAADNKLPAPNLAETAKLKIKLLPPRDPAEKQAQQEPSHDGQPPEKQEKDPQAGAKDKEDKPKKDQANPRQPKDDQQQPGEENQQPPKEGEQQDEGNEGQQEQQGNEKQNGQGEKKDGQENQAQADEQKQPGEEGQEPNEQQQPGAGEAGKEGDGEQGNEGAAGGGAGKEGKEGEAGEQEGSDAGAGDQGKDGQRNRKPGGKESGEGDQPGEPGAGEPSSKPSSRRVDPDAQDGDAFDRMMEHFDQQEKQPGKQSTKKPDQQSKNDAGKEGEAAQDEGQQDQPGAAKDDQATDGAGKASDQPADDPTAEPGQEGAKGAGEKAKPGEGKQPENQEGVEKAPTKDNAAGDAAEQTGQPGEGKAQPKTDKGEKETGEEKTEPDVNQPAADQQQEGGAGQPLNEKNSGTPEAQGKNKQKPKDGGEEKEEQGKGKDEPQSPSNSNNQSKTKGEEAGDQSGAGKSVGGQNADQDGTGSAGSNTEADEGAGAGKQSGDGETGEQGGNDQESPNATGDENAQPSAGKGRTGDDGKTEPDAEQKQGDSGKQPSGKTPPSGKQPNQQPRNEGDDANDASGTPGEGTPNGLPQGEPSKQDQPANPAEPNGRGQAGDKAPVAPPPKQGELGGDEANQDYANRATDLVLDRLKDQLKKGEPDEALLDKLQWTKQDLERFVKRWEAMKAAAKQSGASGQKARDELDQALKGLGLRPRGTSTRAGQTKQDTTRGVRDSRQSEPPAEYAEQYRQYNVGTSKGR